MGYIDRELVSLGDENGNHASTQTGSFRHHLERSVEDFFQGISAGQKMGDPIDDFEPVETERGLCGHTQDSIILYAAARKLFVGPLENGLVCGRCLKICLVPGQGSIRSPFRRPHGLFAEWMRKPEACCTMGGYLVDPMK